LILPNWKGNAKLVSIAILSVAAGVALIVSIFNSNESILEQFDYSNKLIQGKIAARIESETGEFSAEDLKPELLNELSNFDFTPVLEKKVYEPKTKTVLTLLGVDLLNDYRFRDYAFDSDKPPIVDLISPDKASLLISKSTLERLGWEGSTQKIIYGSKEIEIKLSDVSLQDIGLVKAEDGLILLGDIKYVQQLLNQNSGVQSDQKFTSLDFLDAKPADLKAQLAQHPEYLQGFKVSDPAKRRSEIESLTSAFRFNLQALSFIALLVAAYLIFQTIFISFQRKTKLIGIVRVLGMSNQQIFLSLCLESLLIGFLGVILGCMLGLLLSKFVLQALQTTVNQLYFSVRSSELIFSPKGLIIGSSIGLLTSFLAGLPSAFLALQVQPNVNLRSQAFMNLSKVNYEIIFFLYILGCIFLISLFSSQTQLFQIQNRYIGFLMALIMLLGVTLSSGALLNVLIKIISGFKNWYAQLIIPRLSANFIRLWIAIGALICGLSMTLSINIMIDSFRDTVKNWTNQTLKADIYISQIYDSKAGINSQLIQTIKSWPEVLDIDYLSSHSSELNGKHIDIGGNNIKLHIKHLIFIEKLPKLSELLISPASIQPVIVSNTLAIKHRMKLKDQFELNTKIGKQKFLVAAIYQDYSSEHGMILVSHDIYKKLFNNSQISNIGIYVKDFKKINILKVRLNKLEESRFLKIQTNSQLRKIVLEIFDQTFQISYLFFWIALIISIFTVSLTLFSCIEENAYLNIVKRYLGVSLGQLYALEIGQSLIITFIALLVSLPSGYWLAYILQNTVNNNSFGWIIYLKVNSESIIFISICSLIGSVIGSIFPIWSQRKLIAATTLIREMG
jgi:putative ABC transport system permease protein